MQAKDLLVTGDVRVVGDIYSPSLDFTPALTSGTHIGTLKMNGKTIGLFAPVGGESSGGGTTLGELGISVSADNINQLANISGNVQTQLNGKAPSSHTHDDRYYTESEVNNLLAGKQAAGSYAPASHTHDDRYYTESEVNNLLAGKQAAGSYAPASHTHDDRYYTESEINSLLNNKSNSSHTHDDRYYTESEVNNLLAGKQAAGSYAPASHTHNYAGSSSAGGSATSAVKLDGGAYIVASASEPTNSNCLMWIKTS